MELKRCCRCKETKDTSQFNRDGAKADGLALRCRDCSKEYGRRWFSIRGKQLRKDTGFYKKPGRVKYQEAYYRANRERCDAHKRKWLTENIDKHRVSTREAMRRRRSTAKGRLEANVSRALNRALRGRKNGEPSFTLLGFTVEDLMAHLERQFQRGMTWDNYGKWHVDHILPLASFDYSSSSDSDFARAWALTNLRPLWARENISKGAKRLLLT